MWFLIWFDFCKINKNLGVYITSYGGNGLNVFISPVSYKCWEFSFNIEYIFLKFKTFINIILIFFLMNNILRDAYVQINREIEKTYIWNQSNILTIETTKLTYTIFIKNAKRKDENRKLLMLSTIPKSFVRSFKNYSYK